MQRWVVLGAGGCFGQDLAAHLLELGHQVIGIGRSPRKPACFSLGIDKYPYHAYHITYEHEYIVRLLEQFAPDVIVNYAAQGEGAASFGWDSWRFYETNAMGLARLYEGIRPLGARFIHIGTSELYGSVDHPAKETDPIKPSSPYAASKAAFDLHLLALFKTYGASSVPMNIIRPSNCYCPGQQLHRIIPKALLHGVKNLPLVLYGGGRAEKSYLHARDLSRAVLAVERNGIRGEIYNVAPPNATSIRQVVEFCEEALGKIIEITAGDERTGEDARYWLDSSKVGALGWKQQIDWKAGLAAMVRWIRAYPELLEMPIDFRMRA